MPGQDVTAAERFREVMGHFATGVTLVSGVRPDGTAVGLTANAVASISLEPALLMVSVDRESSSLPVLLESGRFAVSVLRAEHNLLARRFSAMAPEDRFDGLPLRNAGSGVPILDDCLAWIDCRMWKVVEAGDHLILLGEVVGCGAGDPGPPLIFFRGEFGTVDS